MYLYTASAPTLLAQTETPQVQCMVFPHVSQNWEASRNWDPLISISQFLQTQREME